MDFRFGRALFSVLNNRSLADSYYLLTHTYFRVASAASDNRTNRWLSTRLQYLQCVSNGDTAVLYWAFERYDWWMPLKYRTEVYWWKLPCQFITKHKKARILYIFLGRYSAMNWGVSILMKCWKICSSNKTLNKVNNSSRATDNKPKNWGSFWCK